METEITTMVMLENPETGELLVIDRLKKYKGISFVGGHIEKGESVYACACREVQEETGLEVKNLCFCGIIDWAKATGERYIEFLFKTSDYSGNLKNGTDEGNIFWLHPDRFCDFTLSDNFEQYLPMFFSDGHSEAFGEWTDSGAFTGLTYL